MKKTLAPLVVLAAIATSFTASASAARSGSPVQSARGAALYRIPHAPPSTPAASARVSASGVVGVLAGTTPAGLAAKGASKFDAGVSGPGTLEFVLSAKLDGKTVVIGRGRKTVVAAGTVVVKIALTGAGKVALASHRGRLRVAVSVIFKVRGGGEKTASAVATLK